MRIHKYIFLVIIVCCLIFGSFSYAENDPDSFSFSVAEEYQSYLWRLTDNNLDSRISFLEKSNISVHVPDGCGAVTVEWFKIPTNICIEQTDSECNVIGSETVSGLYENRIICQEKTQTISISSDYPFSISEIFDSSDNEDYVPWSIPEKPDLMFFFAHPCDESLYFSSLLYYYGHISKNIIQTVYFSSLNRSQMHEAMQALKSFGINMQPIFLNNRYMFLEERYASKASLLWNTEENIQSTVQLLRKFKPTVVITHSSSGDGAEYMHSYVNDIVSESVRLSADQAHYSDSYKIYGSWAPSRTCILSNSGSTYVDETMKKEIIDAASNAIQIYKSLAIYRLKVSEEIPKFDLLSDSSENGLPEEYLINTNNEAEVENVPLGFTKLSNKANNRSDVSFSILGIEPSNDVLSSKIVKILVLGFGLLLSVVILLLLFGKAKGPILLLSVIPFLLSILISFVLMNSEEEFVNNDMDSSTTYAVINDTSQVLPPDNISVDNDELISNVNDNNGNSISEDGHEDIIGIKDDSFFTKEGEDEIVESDYPSGNWEYKSDTLSVIIDRRDLIDLHNKPVVYYVAHIRMRNVDAFRPGFGDYSADGHARCKPWEMARRYKAVLAITGDNLIQSGRTKKGILIRNGELFWKSKEKVDTLALLDNMTMKIYPAGTKAETVLEDGVMNTYGFGPVLVNNGEVNPVTKKHPLKNKNPRTGIGMISQGHYVAIVCDGRQAGYSVGLSLIDFAQLFVDEGCSVAYNMDGGISSGMVFMGEHVNLHKSSRAGNSSSQRKWPDGLLFGYSELVPSIDDPVMHTGNRNEENE